MDTHDKIGKDVWGYWKLYTFDIDAIHSFVPRGKINLLGNERTVQTFLLIFIVNDLSLW